jgi:hypothetical protein
MENSRKQQQVKQNSKRLSESLEITCRAQSPFVCSKPQFTAPQFVPQVGSTKQWKYLQHRRPQRISHVPHINTIILAKKSAISCGLRAQASPRNLADRYPLEFHFKFAYLLKQSIDLRPSSTLSIY